MTARFTKEKRLAKMIHETMNLPDFQHDVFSQELVAKYPTETHCQFLTGVQHVCFVLESVPITEENRDLLDLAWSINQITRKRAQQ